MSKICVSKCMNDAIMPVRATYVNLYKWPESDTEFMRSATAHGGPRQNSRVVDSVSCRQMYLRSYTFSRKETVPERTIKCLGNVRRRLVAVAGGEEKRELRQRRKRRRRRWCVVVRRVREFSRAMLSAVFRRLLSCTTTVDVADRRV